MDTQLAEVQTLLVENTLDILANLRDSTKMTSAIAILHGNKLGGTVLASLAGNCDHCYVPRVGSHFQLHCTAPGKALLAAQPREERNRIAAQLEYTQFTAKTPKNAEEFADKLEKDSQQGFSIDLCEYVEGVNCIASCIRSSKGTPIAAIWITALSIDLSAEQIPEFTNPVLRATKDIELRLLQALEDPNAQTNATVEEAKRYIDIHFVNATSIQTYFDNMHLSYSWFRKLFKDKYGIAPNQYRQHLLHERAKKLIRNTNLSIKEIAFQLNYETQHYFSRAFKKQEGLSPIQYREHMK